MRGDHQDIPLADNHPILTMPQELTSEERQDALYLEMVSGWMSQNELAMLRGLQKISPAEFRKNREHWFASIETALLNGIT